MMTAFWCLQVNGGHSPGEPPPQRPSPPPPARLRPVQRSPLPDAPRPRTPSRRRDGGGGQLALGDQCCPSHPSDARRTMRPPSWPSPSDSRPSPSDSRPALEDAQQTTRHHISRYGVTLLSDT